MNRITIYPKDNLKDKIIEGADRDNRSLNNFILDILQRELCVIKKKSED